MFHSKQLVMQKLLNTNAHLALRAPYSDRFVPYLYGLRNEMAIIDLENTLISLRRSCHMIGLVVRARGHLLFVNNNSEYNKIIQSTAFIAKQSYINHKWMGGLLTNWHHMQNVQHHFQACFAHTINSSRFSLELTPKAEVRRVLRDGFRPTFDMHSREPRKVELSYGILSSKTLKTHLTRSPKSRRSRSTKGCLGETETVGRREIVKDVSYLKKVSIQELKKQSCFTSTLPRSTKRSPWEEKKLLGEARKDSESYVRLVTAEKKGLKASKGRRPTGGQILKASRTFLDQTTKQTAYDNKNVPSSELLYKARKVILLKEDKGAKDSNIFNSFSVNELHKDTLTGTVSAPQYNTSNINVTNIENVNAFPKNLLKSFPRFKKMQKCFEGLIAKQLPDCVIVLNASQNSIVINEAKQLRIPIISLVDSNTPHELHQMITYPIPANDDSLKFVYLFCNCILKTVLLSKSML